MNTPHKKLIALAACCAVLVMGTGCATSPLAPPWVINPVADGGGVVAGECVPSSGQLSIDRQQAVALARAQLAQQLEVRIEAMAQTYAQKRGSGRDTQLVSRFTSISKQTVDKTMNNTKVVRMEEFKGRNGRELCALVSLPETQARELVRVVATTATGADASKDEDALYESFRSAKTS